MNILFIRFSSLGDTVLVTGVLRAFVLKTSNKHTINILTFKEYTDIFEGADFVNKIYTVPKAIPLGGYIEFLKSLPPFDITVDLHCNLRSRLAGYFAAGKVLRYNKRPFARRAFVKFRLCRKELSLHTVERYAAGFYPFFGLDVPNREELRPFIAKSAAASLHKNGKKAIIIHPFASKPTKEWCYFPKLTEVLMHSGFDVQIIGKPSYDISGAYPIPHTPTPEISDLIKIIGKADLLVATDSGPMHIAIALGVKVIAIFGSTSKELGFYPDFSGATVMEEDLPCRPCHIHGAEKCRRGDFACMQRITPDKVFDAVLKVLSGA
ncbi:MAG: glycosyltransferase family 9 protein [Deferribacteraceae bacterium]|jgi:ADP-heptose:LPS heptosyltransferase|nr:glycosyltransferase family 9 protein [Deferribacteraceae bacterium]